MREHSLNPTRRECVVVAKAITQKYPNSFLDKNEEGELIGCGYFSVINQLKTRVEYLNRGNSLSRLRKHKRTQRDDEDGDDDQPAVATCARIDSYGCVRWQPEDYPDGETSASLVEKKLEMMDIFSREGLKGTERGRVEDLMAITYAKQREYINAKPSPSILDVGKEWPFLFSQKFLLSHFTTLTNVELYTRLNEDLDKKGKRLLDFFSSQITKWRKEVRAVLKEAIKKDREGSDGLAAMLVMLAHFKEQEESLFLIADVDEPPIFQVNTGDYHSCRRRGPAVSPNHSKDHHAWRDNPDCKKMDAVDRGEGRNPTWCSHGGLHHCLGRSLRLLLCIQPRVSGGSQHNTGVCSEVFS
ncbi:uncharacterized protein LOC125263257 isoform X3 [Megalobrama amblycephala]|uniref:uncharacterized protein LOC125245000 isoform X3 n=1 Tax=Megalobrama amblycephala TaxID=75352 RepID=UPI0020142336|nr:uncharacterized protein LOC125245000 isoform X3 [Megalobrama amblycephala]XP_048012913.1 uncharacterized protein LOC125246100 isoform X3 [Megalobrama amblycephala]XP_048038212.1 uncharacterized protein LOC125263257 isoform X3 [Megalobrama amblycephala]